MHQTCATRTAGAEHNAPGSWRRWALAAQVVAGAATLATAASADSPKTPVLTPAQQTAYLKSHPVNVHALKPMTVDAPTSRAQRLAKAHLLSGVGVGVTVPYWTTSIRSPLDGNTYTVSMVGSSPYALHPSNTNVTYVPVVVRIHLDGFVLDPTQNSHCDTQSPARRFFNSPLFRPNNFVSNGVNVTGLPGGTQFESAFQRANFWNAVKGTGYGVTLIPSRLDPIVVDWYPQNPNDMVGSVPDNCGGLQPVPFVDINEFDAELQTIAATYATPAQVPVSLAVDTAIYTGLPVLNNCCVLGYHNAVSVSGGTQVYAIGAYFDSNQVFGGAFPDVTVWTHELGELIDDPFVQSIPGAPGGVNNDLTPPWGNVGQVQGGCQNNLEVGDPLTPGWPGSPGVYPTVGVGGFVYHNQDLAFHDWFYRTPSTSTGGRYSFEGNFKTVQGVCT